LNKLNSDKTKAAVCGLFCPSCTLYIATTEEPKRLKALAERLNIPAEEIECRGCRSDKLGFFCRKHCKMRTCAAEKGIEFCGECREYPCSELIDFQSKLPHRKELFNSLESIKKAGWEKWYSEMSELYSCKFCGTINSAYDFKCRNCSADPGCEYVARYGDEIKRHPTKLKP
jgi:hypothetical protein